MNIQKESSWGGARPGAGRKHKDTELKEFALMDAVIEPDAWQRLFLAVFEKACAGNVSAARLILERRFGRFRVEEDLRPEPQPGSWFDDGLE